MRLAISHITCGRRQTMSAFSLLEMVMATALVTGMLVPALVVIRDSMAQSREMHCRNLLANYAVRILEDEIATTATNWTSSTANGDFSADGHPAIRYSLTKSDDPSDGGIVDHLMNIELTVYYDSDGDLALDVGEVRETYRTKVAKMLSYENEAS